MTHKIIRQMQAYLAYIEAGFSEQQAIMLAAQTSNFTH